MFQVLGSDREWGAARTSGRGPLMVAYSCQPGFVAPIEAGSKLHTLRNPRKRHARPAEELQLYTGMRTRSCRLIARKTCSQVLGVWLDLYGSTPVQLYEIAELVPGEPRRIGPFHAVVDVEAFAIADGFTRFEVLARFWRKVHKVRRWDGVLIGWGPRYLREPDLAAVGRVALATPASPPAPWSADPWAWHPPAIAAALAAGGWTGAGLRRYRSTVDGRVYAIGGVGGTPTWLCEAGTVHGEHASLEDVAAVLIRVDRAAAADSDWAPLAQRTEHRNSTPKVTGSIPAGRTIDMAGGEA